MSRERVGEEINRCKAPRGRVTSVSDPTEPTAGNPTPGTGAQLDRRPGRPRRGTGEIRVVNVNGMLVEGTFEDVLKKFREQTDPIVKEFKLREFYVRPKERRERKRKNNKIKARQEGR